MRIYCKNNPAKFHPDPIWNDWALSFFEEVASLSAFRRQLKTHLFTVAYTDS